MWLHTGTALSAFWVRMHREEPVLAPLGLLSVVFPSSYPRPDPLGHRYRIGISTSSEDASTLIICYSCFLFLKILSCERTKKCNGISPWGKDLAAQGRSWLVKRCQYCRLPLHFHPFPTTDAKASSQRKVRCSGEWPCCRDWGRRGLSCIYTAPHPDAPKSQVRRRESLWDWGNPDSVLVPRLVHPQTTSWCACAKRRKHLFRVLWFYLLHTPPETSFHARPYRGQSASPASAFNSGSRFKVCMFQPRSIFEPIFKSDVDLWAVLYSL